MIMGFKNTKPQIHESCFIAPTADIIGDVILEEDVNIWFGTVIRADGNAIKIGKNTNIQDNSVVHIAGENIDTIIGENVTVGHNAIVHGCVVGDNCLIGMGAIILNRADIGNNTIIGAGSLVTEGKKIPSGVLCLGSPAKVIRNLTEEEIDGLKKHAQGYVDLSKDYK
ncbi:gamma carbonic anhydrase family protein [Clostridium frigidicarnis]|uniref:Carbonic anhydrase or acetyltransferase, isoleucine patch superfamily n=1 Tax=Clostridium frigidicarnis TaxID=84698 RepID=A0A1I0W9M2_9CLOT|nr:gamma carbonic anhydrase family protein [Clostridium frigidicarnis]SFA85311.1 Carbonic anhydrase or acetyltransferase, isoleucine patch superfamily [Clostridium frigidicarnis]